jgi:hypothetical protein
MKFVQAETREMGEKWDVRGMRLDARGERMPSSIPMSMDCFVMRGDFIFIEVPLIFNK